MKWEFYIRQVEVGKLECYFAHVQVENIDSNHNRIGPFQIKKDLNAEAYLFDNPSHFHVQWLFAASTSNNVSNFRIAFASEEGWMLAKMKYDQ